MGAVPTLGGAVSDLRNPGAKSMLGVLDQPRVGRQRPPGMPPLPDDHPVPTRCAPLSEQDGPQVLAEQLCLSNHQIAHLRSCGVLAAAV